MRWNEETYVKIPFCNELEKLGWPILSLNKHQLPFDSHRTEKIIKERITRY